MVTRLMLIFLCLGILSTVTGCYFEPTGYGTFSSGEGAYQAEQYGGGTNYETLQYRKQWGGQDGAYHPWERRGGYGNLSE